MSGPSRELPPLVIRIYGDHSDVLDSFKGIIDAAKGTAKTIIGIARKQRQGVDAEFEREFTNYRLLQKAKALEAEREFKNYALLQKVANQTTVEENRKTQAAANREVKVMTDAGAARNAGVAASRAAIAKQSQATLKEINDEVTAREAAANREVKVMTDAGAARNAGVAASRAAIAKQSQAVTKEIEDEVKARQDAIEKENKLMQQAHQQRAAEVAKSRAAIAKQGQDVAKEIDKEARARSNDLARRKSETQKTNQAIRDHFERINRPARTRRAATGGFTGIGDNMLGARADMYMHSAAIGNISSGIRSVLEPWAQLESHIATIKVFTGSMEKAREVAAEMQQFALVSPYSLNSVMEATGLLMKFGQSSTDAMATVQMLGDVAGGSSERLKHVALGLAQAVSLGRLQGQELRQMTEGGFNPLRIAAEHASGVGVKASYTDEEEKLIKRKMAEYDGLMRARKLDAKFAVAALKLTTSKGGRHHGAVNEAAMTPIGLATQITESIDLVAVETVKIFDKEIRAMLKSTLETITAFIAWMKVNKDTVASFALLTTKIVGAFLAFHILSWAIASSKWMLHSFFSLFKLGYRVVYGMVWAVYSLATAFTAEGAAAFSAWMATLGPVAIITAGIVALIAYVAILGVTIAALGNDNGLQGVFDNILAFGQFLVGFFYNIGYNLPKTFEFIAANWGVMCWDMVSMLNKAMETMALMLYDLFMVKLPQMIQYGMDPSNFVNQLTFGLSGILMGGGVPRTEGGYDTSMLKLDTPNPLGFLDAYKKEGGLGEPKVPDFLKKYMQEDGTFKINFDDFTNAEGGPETKKGRKGAIATREHALVGSNEQAQRTYDYTQAMMGSTGAVTKDNAPLKQVALLEQIAKNTQPDFNRGDSIGDMDID